MLRVLIATFLLLLPAPAFAAWRQGTSTHFVLYSEASAQEVRESLARLEKFQFVLRTVASSKAPSSPTKVILYRLTDARAVRDTMQGAGSGVAGYYSVSVDGGPMAVLAGNDIRGQRGSRGEILSADFTAQHVLFHELTHHFSFQYFPAAYPLWYSEGFAEFMGSMAIGTNDVVSIGQPVQSRYASFTDNSWLPVRTLVAARSYRDLGTDVDLLYAEGWLLVHYLMLNPGREGQLKAYLAAVNAGVPFERAATEAFGNLDALDRELRGYAGRGKLQMMQLPFKKIDVGPITVRELSPVESALVPFDLRLRHGLGKRELPGAADRAIAAAGRFPSDPSALRIAYEAARQADRLTEAEQTAERWRATAPNDGMAIAAVAEAKAARLVAAKSTDAAAWGQVRRLYGDAAAKSPNQPRILRAFYDSYVDQGVFPPAAAQSALYSAFELLPQEQGLRIKVAGDFEQRGMIDEAIAVIKPAAYESPDVAAENARKKAEGDDKDQPADPRGMLARLEAKKAKKNGGGRPVSH